MRGVIRWSLALVLVLGLASPAWALWWCWGKKCYVCPPPKPSSSSTSGGAGASTAPSTAGKSAADTAPTPTTFGDPNGAQIQADFDYWNRYLGRSTTTTPPPVEHPSPANLVKALQDAYNADAAPRDGKPAVRDRLVSAYRLAAAAISAGAYDQEFPANVSGQTEKQRTAVSTVKDVETAIGYYRRQRVQTRDLRGTQQAVMTYVADQGKIDFTRDAKVELTDARRKELAGYLRDAADALTNVK
jgi:hypothetical protein